MGMNMVTKGVHTVIEYLTYDFPYMDVIGIFVKTSVAVLVELNMLNKFSRQQHSV
ncbi:BnaCnng05710D [Brassica napus]|uniref:BnaCnng05710D protein n=1 Tax=Brassica napus TaxID=3708 RepID=A0A078GQ65_BRANA|nr:BnaCnng05710D [Brassica napus]